MLSSSAGEVNANFSALETGINNNEERIDGNQESIDTINKLGFSVRAFVSIKASDVATPFIHDTYSSIDGGINSISPGVNGAIDVTFGGVSCIDSGNVKGFVDVSVYGRSLGTRCAITNVAPTGGCTVSLACVVVADTRLVDMTVEYHR